MIEWDMREFSKETVEAIEIGVNGSNRKYMHDIRMFKSFLASDFKNNSLIGSQTLTRAVNSFFRGSGENTFWHDEYNIGDIFNKAISEYDGKTSQGVLDFFKKIINKSDCYTDSRALNGWMVIQSAKISNCGSYEMHHNFPMIKDWLDKKKERFEEIRKGYIIINGGLTV
jgi:hypothetical protein